MILKPNMALLANVMGFPRIRARARNKIIAATTTGLPLQSEGLRTKRLQGIDKKLTKVASMLGEDCVVAAQGLVLPLSSAQTKIGMF
jgi:ABC-type molybdate transport system permease subunit